MKRKHWINVKKSEQDLVAKPLELDSCKSVQKCPSLKKKDTLQRRETLKGSSEKREREKGPEKTTCVFIDLDG